MFVIVLLFSHVKTDILLIGTNFDSMYSLSYQHVMKKVLSVQSLHACTLHICPGSPQDALNPSHRPKAFSLA